MHGRAKSLAFLERLIATEYLHNPVISSIGLRSVRHRCERDSKADPEPFTPPGPLDLDTCGFARGGVSDPELRGGTLSGGAELGSGTDDGDNCPT